MSSPDWLSRVLSSSLVDEEGFEEEGMGREVDIDYELSDTLYKYKGIDLLQHTHTHMYTYIHD